MSIVYLNKDDLYFAFKLVREIKYALQEQVPNYENEQSGIAHALGALERIQSDNYATLHEKAATLFITIAKGHYFSNGNKRLAICLLWGMFIFNKCTASQVTEEKALDILKSSFPEIPNFVDDIDLSAREDALYNLAFITVESGSKYPYTFDELKDRVAKFLEMIFVPK